MSEVGMEKASIDDEARPQRPRPAPQPDTTAETIARVPTYTSLRTRQPSQALSLTRTPSAVANPSFSTLHEIGFIAIVCSAQLLTQCGLAQSIAPLNVIGASFSTTNPGKLSWLPAAYSLTVGTFILPAGRWGDLYGHKRLFVIGYCWFAVWSLIAGFSVYSKSLVFFAFCRAMQGMGPALILPNGIAILSRVYPPGPRKAMVLSVFGATAPGGFMLGAVFAGIFAQLAWWPWAFWVLGVGCVAVAGIAWVVIPGMPVVGAKPRIEELDLVGSLLGVVGLVLVNFAWNEGPAEGWGRVYVYVLLIVGFVALAAFLYVELKRSKYPLLPRTAFTRDTSFVFACIAAGWASFGIWVFYFWQLQTNLRHQSILLTVAQQSPVAISGACAAIFTGWMIGKMQPGFIMMISMSFFAAGTILLATTPVHQTYWANTFVAVLIISWGMDLSFPSGVIVLSNKMPPEHQGLAASLVNTVVNYSISIGLGMAGTVETHVNAGGRNLLGGYRGAWYLGIGLDGLGFILAICLTLSWRATVNAKEKERDKLEAA